MDPRRWILPILALGVGLGLGFQMQPSAEPAPPPAPVVSPSPVVVEREVTVEKEVQVEVVPADCREAVKMSDEMWRLVQKYESNLGIHKTALSDAHSAVVLKDIEAMLEADKALRKLRSDTLNDLLEMRNVLQKYKTVHASCMAKLK